VKKKGGTRGWKESVTGAKGKIAGGEGSVGVPKGNGKDRELKSTRAYRIGQGSENLARKGKLRREDWGLPPLIFKHNISNLMMNACQGRGKRFKKSRGGPEKEAYP